MCRAAVLQKHHRPEFFRRLICDDVKEERSDDHINQQMNIVKISTYLRQIADTKRSPIGGECGAGVNDSGVVST